MLVRRKPTKALRSILARNLYRPSLLAWGVSPPVEPYLARRDQRDAVEKPRVTIMQRQANWNPVIVSSSNLGTGGQTQASASNDAIAGPAISALSVSYPPLDWQNKRRSDLRFSIGVAIALALPAILALGFYAVAESIMLIG
jgi:hypothetical protein